MGSKFVKEACFPYNKESRWATVRGETTYTRWAWSSDVSCGKFGKKAEMEFGMNCRVPPTVCLGLKTFSNIFPVL